MSRVTFLVIPSEVEESLTFCLSSIRDVSTSLDMTKNGQHESDLPFSGNRRHRVPLLLRRPRRRVRLHRRDDAVRARSHYHPADCVGTEHSGCAHRVFSILAGRPFLMEIILAVRAPFHPGCLLRRLSPVTGSSFENHYRTRAARLRRPIVFSSRRSPGGRSATLARRTRGWFRHRLSLRLTGTGGGIFLTALLLFSNWAKTKQASAVSALFILVNSIAGLAGFVSAKQSIPALAFILSVAAIVGGAIGSYLGSRQFPVRTVSILLATVLVIAGSKLIFTR